MGKNDIISIDKVEYQKWLQNLCDEIDRQRLKAVMQLNASTLQHYWWLGNDILKKQQAQGWGAKVIDMLSTDLMKRYGNDSGYSIRNLKYMRQFAVEYPDFPFVQVPLAQLQENQVLKSRLSKFTVTADGEFVQVPLAQITWYHHISMIPKVKDVALRAFYMTEAAIQGWNRDIMMMQIEDSYFKKAQALPNNFDATLPPANSDLARAAFKDPYNLGFVDMTKVMREKDLEEQLANKVTDFLLELGKGFSYIGHQYPLNIAGEENKVDLMMYHTRLHCYVAIELKVVDFKPEFLNRLSGTVVFNEMDKTMATLILDKKLRQLSQRLAAKNVTMTLAPQAHEFLLTKGFTKQYGAREMDRVIQQYLTPILMEEILFGKLKKGGEAKIVVENDNQLKIEN